MRILYFIVSFVLLSQMIFARYYIPFGYDSLSINNWNVRINANNSNFWDMAGDSKAEWRKLIKK